MTEQTARQKPPSVKRRPKVGGQAVPAKSILKDAVLIELRRSRVMLNAISQTHQHVPSDLGDTGGSTDATPGPTLPDSDDLQHKRTWYTLPDMRDETAVFHAVAILEWAIVIKDAPTSGGNLIQTRLIKDRLEKRLSRSDAEFQYTTLGTQLFRSMRYLLHFQGTHQAYHPYVDLVLEYAASTGMAEMAKTCQPNNLVELNPMVEDATSEGGVNRTDGLDHGIDKHRGHPQIKQFGHYVQAFTDLIRDKLNDRSFGNRLRDRQRLFAARESGALKWLDSIFRANEHVQVKNLELAFKLDGKCQMPFEFTRSVWTGFWNNLRHQDVAKRLIGRQWTLHWIEGRGFVYRCLLIFDTTAQPADIEMFKACWIRRFPGVTQVAESDPNDPFSSLVSICGDLSPQRERLEYAVQMQCWYGWLLEIKGTKPSQTYGRSECLQKSGIKRSAQLSSAQALDAYMEMAAMSLID